MIDHQTITNTTEAEKSLIACFLLSPDTFNVIGDSFTSKDFHDSRNGLIFDTIKSLVDNGEPVDLVSVSQRVKTSDLKLYLSETMSSVSAPSNYEYYGKLVKEFSTRRQLIEIGQTLSYQATGETKTQDLIKDLEQRLADITSTTKGGEIDTAEAVDEVLENVRRLKDNPRDVTGVTTGFETLDKKTSGLHSSDLLILAARPARGKSAFALQLARNVCLKGRVPTLFFSLEMGADQLVQRLIAAESKVDMNRIRSGSVSNMEMEALEISSQIIKTLPLYINDKAGVQVKDIRSSIKLHNSKSQDKIGFVIVDYLQLMAIGNGKGDSMVQMVTEISRGLKMIAKEFNIPVMALSQLSRKVEDRGGRPRLSDLRDSGSIEQDADIVMFIHSESIDTDSFGNIDTEILIEKHRNGSTGSIPMKFEGAKMTFHEVDESMDINNW